MTKQSIKEARELLTAEKAVEQLEVSLIRHEDDCRQFECIPEDWMPQTAAALEWAIELLKAEADGMLLRAGLPIGTTVYQLCESEREQTCIIDGEEYIRKVPNWWVTQHEYGWIDAMCDAERPERKQLPHVKYYLSLEEALAECERLNLKHRKGENKT